MILEAVSVGPMKVNCYILAEKEGSRAIIIDPGDQGNKIQQALDKYKLKPAFIINTHGHIDHIAADSAFDLPVYIHSKDALSLKDATLNLSQFLEAAKTVNNEIKTLKDKELISLDGLELEVMHTPGHTPGGISLLVRKPVNKILFSGDTLFFQSVGRTDFPNADHQQLIRSIKEKLWALSDDTVIYPGHGPASTIGEEKSNNPFLN